MILISHKIFLEVFSFDKVDDEDVHEVKGDVVRTITGSLSIDIQWKIPLKVVKKGLKRYTAKGVTLGKLSKKNL